jgi:hypothetical protein
MVTVGASPARMYLIRTSAQITSPSAEGIETASKGGLEIDDLRGCGLKH